MRKKIVLIGAGGHFRVVLDAIRKRAEYEAIGVVDKVKHDRRTLFGLRYLGSDSMLEEIFKSGVVRAFLCVGSIGKAGLRIKLAALLDKIGFELPIIVHPSAIIGADVKISKGAFLSANSVIGPSCVVGKNVIINTAAVVEHDCDLGDFVHVASGATLSGGVKVGKATHIGAGACVIEYKKIGTNVLIGAGSVVVSDIKSNCLAYGNPCKIH